MRPLWKLAQTPGIMARSAPRARMAWPLCKLPIPPGSAGSLGGLGARGVCPLPMSSKRHVYRWRPSSIDPAQVRDPGQESREPERPLRERFAPLAADRASCAAALVREASEVLVEWLLSRPRGWGATASHGASHGAFLTTLLSCELARFRADQAWRGPVARWLSCLEGALALAQENEDVTGLDLLVEELGLWLGGIVGVESSLELEGAAAGHGLQRSGVAGSRVTASGLSGHASKSRASHQTQSMGREIGGVLFPAAGSGASLRRGQGRVLAPLRPWDGQPLVAGERLPRRELCAPALLAGMSPRETVVVHGYSETVAVVLAEAQQRNLHPHLVLSEGGPDVGGRRMARRLAPTGMRVSLCYDAALLDAVADADRVWVGTEAIGVEGFLGRRGTRSLLAHARQLEVPSAVVATSDKLTPAGELQLPRWSEEDRWLLWENAPEGVEVQSQAYEIVDLDTPDAFATEVGFERPADLFTRSMNTGSTFERAGEGE